MSEYGQLIDMDPAPDSKGAVVIDDYCDPPDQMPLRQGRVKSWPCPTPGFGCLSGLAWNPAPDSHQIVAGDDAGKVYVWDADSREVTRACRGRATDSVVQDLAYSGDGSSSWSC